MKRLQSFSRVFALSVMMLLARPGIASLQVDFLEGAPKDRFSVTNTSQCDINDLVLHIDLSTSNGRLIFDTTAAGAGVEVFQPFEIRKGNLTLISSDSVTDGDDQLSVRIVSLLPGEVVSFTIDVDDTVLKSDLGKIRVTDAEIQNGSIRVELAGFDEISALFGDDSSATITLDAC